MSRGVLIIVITVVVLITGVGLYSVFRNNRQIAPSETKLVVWIPFDEAKVYDKISAKYIESNPTVKLEVKYIEAVDSKEYEAKVVNAIANGTGPDIWLIRSDWLPKHVAKSAPLLASKNNDPIALTKELLSEAIVNQGVYDGKLYGVALSFDTLALIYNTKLRNAASDDLSNEQAAKLDDPAKTWALLGEQIKLLNKKSGNTISQSGLASGTQGNTANATDVFSAYLVQNGVTVTNDAGEVVFGTSTGSGESIKYPATEALNNYTQAARPESEFYSWSVNSGDPIDQFAKGKVAALIGYYSTVQQILKKDENLSVSVAALPQLEKDTARVDFLMSWLHIVPSTSSKQSLAWSYITYLNDERTRDLYEQNTTRIAVSPSTSSKPSESYVSASGSIELFRNQAVTGKNLLKPEWQKSDEILQDAIKEVVELKQNPQSVIDSTVQRFKQLISEL